MKRTVFMRLRARQKSSGVAIVTAIFLLVALAGLAVAVVALTTTQQDESVRDVQGARAYQAAKAGIEWALYTGLVAGTPATLAGSGSKTLSLNAATLSSFRVTVTAVKTPGLMAVNGVDAANDPTAGHVTITAVACNQPDVATGGCPNTAPGAAYVQRIITAQL